MAQRVGSALVDQTRLARALGVTPRRVRQMIDDGIVRPATAGKWDLDVEIERYELFKSKDPLEWERVLDELERQSEAVGRLITTAVAPSGTGADIERAAEASDALLERLMLVNAIKAKSPSEREMFDGMFRMNHREQMQVLSTRMFELWSDKTGIPPEIITQKLRDNTAATSA